ncbi:MAG: YggT family protein [Fimbriimonadales bacterium]|nr:YggT family protein [Fimbriimonadales bacterium]
MISPVDLVIWVLRALILIIILDVIFSWIRLAGGRVPRYNPVVRLIERIAEAVLDPFRQLQYRLFRGMGANPLPIDFSPLLAIILIQFLITLLNGLR